MAHDASTGFHDIKPIPQFFPFPTHILWAVLLASAVFIVLHLLFGRSKTRKSSTHLPPAKPPHELALGLIDEIDQSFASGRLDLRNAGTRSSLALRQYLEQTLALQATDLTNRELKVLVPKVIDKALHSESSQQREELSTRILNTLVSLEWLTYSDRSDKSDQYKLQLRSRINDCRMCISQAHSILQSQIVKEKQLTEANKGKAA